MKDFINTSLIKFGLAAFLISFSSFSFSAPSIKGVDQDMSGGTVTAEMAHADDNGWMVVHRTDESMKPGPVIGYASLKMGKNENVNAILMEPVESGDMLMLMVHGEKGGMKTGVFEYTLGAKEDGPVKVDGKLVMDIVRAK
ncbi:DUF7282 domain-containing protein [Vibrio alginolyticus]|uniref:DUF7282 domain-containing protein n=1 Tax=Vibrio alginolyticus TaxID=663 RepID=UPI001EED8C14|nr:hypothetical protein [Vibrio alginolyticus]ULF83471.1 hypothetical protein K6750_05095 [Vibrio alginolyticus]